MTYLHVLVAFALVVGFMLRPLYPRGVTHWVDLSRSGRYGEAKILDPYRDSNSDPSVVQSIASRYTD
jgi:hypothetical protein